MKYLEKLSTAQEQLEQVRGNERLLMSKIAQAVTEAIENATKKRNTCVDYYGDIIPPQLQKELTDLGYELEIVNDDMSHPVYTRISWDK